MNNLQLVQDAALGLRQTEHAVSLDFGPLQALVWPSMNGWKCEIVGDPREYGFCTFAQVLDFVCGEARRLQ